MSYDDHTDCRFCRRHSVDCWCYSTNLWTDEAKDDQSAWCHRPDDPSAHVPAAPWGQQLDAAYKALDRAFLDAKPIEPRTHVLPGDDVLGRIRDAYRLIESAPPRRTEPIKLTEQQIAAIRAQQPERPAWESGVVAPLFGVPIEKVDTVEESTPYLEAPTYATGGIVRPGELGPLTEEGGCSYVIPNRHDPNAKPSGILSFPGKLTDEEFQRFEQHWREKYGNASGPHRVTQLHVGPVLRPLPWWKRAYYRIRRWLT